MIPSYALQSGQPTENFQSTLDDIPIFRLLRKHCLLACLLAVEIAQNQNTNNISLILVIGRCWRSDPLVQLPSINLLGLLTTFNNTRTPKILPQLRTTSNPRSIDCYSTCHATFEKVNLDFPLEAVDLQTNI